ncbi:MAG: hypothetical protein FIA97_16440 [Methylococcaceae bacterium]|nr:hypothetical protein [Methylococcaceae bacterium]
MLLVIIGVAALRAYQNGESARKALAQVQEEQLLQGRLLSLAHNREFRLPSPDEVEILAQRYEGESPDHVGTDFNGIAYYGIYRFQAGASLEEFLAFLRRYDKPLADRLDAVGGVAAASRRDSAFVSAWRALAKDPEKAAEFATLQTDFVKEVLYKRLASRLASGITPPGGRPIRLDLAKRSLALRAVFLSLAVQYGENTTLIPNALGDFGDLAERTDKEIIERLFQFRDRVKDYFRGIDSKSSGYLDLIKVRNQWEKSDALEILRLKPG